MPEEKQLTEQESLALITSMIQKVKGGYHENGTGPILWGTVVSIASFVTYLQREYLFDLPFDIWLIVMAAIIPQIIMVRKERRTRPHVKYEDEAINAVWIVYALTIFGLSAYQAIVPEVSANLLKQDGWQMMKHMLDNSKPDEVIAPFPLSVYSIYILVYAFPTLVTAITKKFTPMLVGSAIAYICFVVSLYTASKYDFLLGAVAAIVCWLIPGIILRRRFLALKKAHV